MNVFQRHLELYLLVTVEKTCFVSANEMISQILLFIRVMPKVRTRLFLGPSSGNERDLTKRILFLEIHDNHNDLRS